MYLVGTWPHMLYVVVCWLSTLSKRKNIRILVGCWSCDRFGRELVAGFAYGEIGRTLDKNSADQHRDQLSECGDVVRSWCNLSVITSLPQHLSSETRIRLDFWTVTSATSVVNIKVPPK